MIGPAISCQRLFIINKGDFTMKRKQLFSVGIILFMLAFLSILLLIPSGKILIIGGILLVAPIAGFVGAIGVSMIYASFTTGWTRLLGILGAFLGVILYSLRLFRMGWGKSKHRSSSWSVL
jgi:hypothetical protein